MYAQLYLKSKKEKYRSVMYNVMYLILSSLYNYNYNSWGRNKVKIWKENDQNQVWHFYIIFSPK